MFGAILSALMSGAGLAAQMGAQSDAQALNWKNYYLQRDTAEENKRLAKATRTDALGNSVEYIPGMGFVTKTTPMVKAILNSMQFENLQRNRVDAPARRKQLLANFKRREGEGDAAHAALAEYRYAPKESEKSFISDAEDLTKYGLDQGTEQTAQAIGRQAVRSGNTQQTRDVFKARSNQLGENMVKALLSAKQQGRSAYANQEAGRGRKLQEALALSGSAGQMDATPMGNDSGAAASLNATQDRQFSGLSDAIKYLGQAQGGALSQLANGELQRGSAMASALANIGKSLGGLDFGGGGTATAKAKAVEPIYEDDDDLLFPQLAGLTRYADEVGYRGNTGAF